METELQRLFQVRAGVYNVLRHFFYYGPQEDNVREMNDLIANANNAGKTDNAMSAENLTQIKEEYTRLFIGPGKAIVSLYETSFRQPEALFMQETTMKLRNIYLGANMISDGVVNLPEDHLAIELEFIYFLVKDALELLKSNDMGQLLQNIEQQREFIQGRIDWITELASMVDECSQCPEINAVFHAMRNFIQEDLSFINGVIEENPKK